MEGEEQADVDRRRRRVIVERLLKENGRRFNNQKLPERYPRGTRGRCFENSSNLLCCDLENFTYCEGPMFPDCPDDIGGFHAWIVDQNGNVIDTTFPLRLAKKYEYIGIPFQLGFVMKTLTEPMEGTYPLLWKILPDLSATDIKAAIKKLDPP